MVKDVLCPTVAKSMREPNVFDMTDIEEYLIDVTDGMESDLEMAEGEGGADSPQFHEHKPRARKRRGT